MNTKPIIFTKPEILTKPVILTVSAFEDFRGYLAVPYDQSINFIVRQINQGQNVLLTVRKVGNFKSFLIFPQQLQSFDDG